MPDKLPEHLSAEDGQDLLNRLLLVALAEILGEGGGVVIDLRGELKNMVPKSKFGKVVVYCHDGHLAVEDCLQDLPHGKPLRVQPPLEQHNSN